MYVSLSVCLDLELDSNKNDMIDENIRKSIGNKENKPI